MSFAGYFAKCAGTEVRGADAGIIGLIGWGWPRFEVVDATSTVAHRAVAARFGWCEFFVVYILM